MNVSKLEAIRLLIQTFENELSVLTRSARAAHEDATHEESISEDKHDTRAIEASYLAAGQTARTLELEKTLKEYRSYLDSLPPPRPTIQEGALIQLLSDGKTLYSFFAQLGGGTQIKIKNETVTVTTALSPLGDALLDSRQGDEIEVETKNGIRTYQVVEII